MKDSRTDEQTDGRKLARRNRLAKAGTTKKNPNLNINAVENVNHMMICILRFMIPCNGTVSTMTLSPVPADGIMSQQFSVTLFSGFYHYVFEVVQVLSTCSVIFTLDRCVRFVVNSDSIQLFFFGT